MILNYADFDVTLHHSKVSDSTLPSEIQGEAGALVIEKSPSARSSLSSHAVGRLRI